MSSYRGWLLDTNVVSELRKPRVDDRVRAFVASQPLNRLHISTVTYAEIRFGIERLADTARRRDIADWLARTLRPLFAGRTHECSEDAVLIWRQLLEAGRRRGHTFSQPDLFVAAVASIAHLVVVSRDTSEFIAAEVPVLDPWSGSYVAADGKRSAIEQLARSNLLETLDFRP